jgi:hypothetical protein
MRLIVTALGFACLATACTGSDDGAGDAGDPAVNCAELQADEFVIGLERAGTAGTLDFTIMSGDPAPPIRGDNTWVVQVSAMSGGVVGAPVTGATLSVTPFMPAHQHGAGKTVIVEPMPDAGQYKLSPVNLWMPGVWETTIDASSASGTDKVVFSFCIPS